MRKIFLVLAATLFWLPMAAQAQFTLVTGTVTDVNAVPYACGTISASIVNQNGQSLYLNGVQFSPNPGSSKLGCPTDPSTSRTAGAFSFQLADNTQIKCGSGASIVTCATQTQWLFTVNTQGSPPPLGTGPQTCVATLTVTGSSQVISSSFSACPALSNGVTSPSNLTSFFNNYTGLSPLDCGNAACAVQDLSAGNGRVRQDGVLSTGSAVVTSATMGFCNAGLVPCSGLESNGQLKTSDVGRQFEAVCSPASVGALTVASVQSTTQATLSATQSTCNGSGFQIFVGSDNTQTLQNWVANGLANHAIHNFYLPKGVYYTTKPLRFVNNNALTECSGVVNPTSGFIFCGLGLLGAGAGQSIIHPATQPNFNWLAGGSASTNTGIFVVSNFSFGIVQGIGYTSDTIGHAATGLNGGVTAGGFLIGPSVSHFYINQNWFNALNVTDAAPNNRAGLVDTGCFECKITANAIESNGVDAQVVLTLAEKETYDDNFLENAASFPLAGDALIIGGTNVIQAMLRNFHIKGPNNNSAGIVFQPGFTISAGYTVEFDGGRMDQGSATDVGAWVRACTGGTIEFNNFDFVNSNNNANVRLMRIDNGPSTCPVIINGGVMSPGGASSIAVLNNGTGGVWMQGVNCLNGCGLSGTGITNQFLQQTNGWGGLGGITGTFFLSNQGTAAANGNIGTLTGWGTGATAAVCSTPPPGFNQSICFTITSGSASFAAAPSVTVTLPNALPASTTPCQLNVVDITGAGGAIMWKETTASATAPVFTAKTNTGAAFTPAASETYTMVMTCGP